MIAVDFAPANGEGTVETPTVLSVDSTIFARDLFSGHLGPGKKGKWRRNIRAYSRGTQGGISCPKFNN
jgi:hypothetical protein